MKIHQLHPSLRPREKALNQGIEALSDRELLALIIRNGTATASALEIADTILNISGGYHGFSKLTEATLSSIHGIKSAKAIEILAVVELSKRIARPSKFSPLVLNSTNQLVAWLNQEIGYSSQEQLLVVGLNQHYHFMGYKIVFKGTMNQAMVHPREIVEFAIDSGSNNLVLVHNHPSGVVKPSSDDIEMTEAMIQVLQPLSISLVDHLIVGLGKNLSLREVFPMLFTNNV